MRLLFLLLFFTTGACAQAPVVPGSLKLLGTRSWIRVQWTDRAADEQGFRVYWSAENKKPAQPGAVVGKDIQRYYIENVKAESTYYIWLEAYNQHGASASLTARVTTVKSWSLDKDELQSLSVASSAAVPEGMELFWNDEFNDLLLNRNKWSTNYYSNIDLLKKDNLALMLQDSLPQPAMRFNGSTIHLFTNDSVPLKSFYPASGRKISSIQTYDWRTNENYLDNSRGGYFEVRVKRWSTGKPQGVNTAFWFDSPGPDLRNYLQKGTVLDGVAGVRPKGQVFEIDVFEMLNAQFVLHGHVSEKGEFIHNLATHIAEGYTHIGTWVTHGILWTPNSIKHYINGKLIKAYDNPHEIYSPNHFMNVFLGSYGAGGSVDMEVDYIRGYQWPLTGGNELPNPGFEANANLLPWGGTGTLSLATKRSGNSALVLQPGQHMEQYVYLNNHTDYKLRYWLQGQGKVELKAENITLVEGKTESAFAQVAEGNAVFKEQVLLFKTGSEYSDYKKTVKIKFTNTGGGAVVIDDVTVVKK
uniref:family 16 glycosylhydrolase n=1 Tax=Pedobacter schmidteae TaxID=2201271 RepID=UPI000EB0E37D|nr:family 16 glycosylhydrolase [Pedobacter schmidteae]